MQQEVKQKLIVFWVVIIAAVLFLLPTVFKYTGVDFTSQWISKPISLGLDLKGGVHLVYEVMTAEAVKGYLQTRGQVIRKELRESKIAVTRAIANDKNQLEITLLSSRSAEGAKTKIAELFTNLTYLSEVPDGERVKLLYGVSEKEGKRIEAESVTQAVETLRNRIDQFGVSEPLIQKMGEKRIMVQMPGVKDVESVKKVVGSVAKLEFRLVKAPGDENVVKLKNREGATTEVEDQPVMTGESVETARVGTQDIGVEVSLTLTSDGARTFQRITTDNVNRQLAIILDNIVYSAPVIREPISGGQASISGRFTFEEAHQLAIVLKSGALPAPLQVLEERTVGPTLGQESIEKGVFATLIGFLVIVVSMIVYYKKAGAVASISLGLNLFLLLAMLSAFGATLTLPGLAGLALTAGMAVDSNVIIFERVRDELKRGAGRDAAVRQGFDRAYSAILDSNVTTFLSAMILFFLGSGPIRGFAVTLAIGIITTMYCAVFVCKLAFDCLPLKEGDKGLSV